MVSAAPPSQAAPRWSKLFDAALVAFAALVGAVHLTVPLGREQALPAYAARAWLFGGTTPYEGTLTLDPPGMLLLHALVAPFSESSPVPFRLLCLASALAVGLLAPLVAVPRDTPIAPGVRGLSACAASLFAHGYFDFWGSGRGGVFVALCLLGAAAVLLRDRHAVRGPLLAGALTAAALLLRPAAFPFVPLLLGAAWSSVAPSDTKVRFAGARRAGLMAAGTLGTGALLLLPFARGHGLREGYDLLWNARCIFLGEPRWEAAWWLFHAAAMWGWYEPAASPLAFVFLASGALAAVRGDRARLGRVGFIAGFAVASFTSLQLIRSTDSCETELFVGFLTLVVASISQTVAEAFPTAMRRAQSVLLLQCIFLYAISCWEIWTPPAVYGLRWRALYRRVVGTSDAQAYLKTFDKPELSFYPAENLEVATWLRAHTAPGDPVLVRGHEPEIYLLAGRRTPGRFFSTGQLVWNNCAYRRDEWLAQDREQYTRGPTRPRIVVAIVAPPGVDAAETFLPLGFVERLRTPHYVVLERE